MNNSFSPDRTHPANGYADTMQSRRHYEEESDRRQGAITEDIKRLREEREECMKLASNHAGAVGLVYVAKTNSYTKYISDIEKPEVPPAPSRPERPEPQLRKAPTRLSVIANKMTNWFLNSAHWYLAILPGLFVGYGLTSLTGLNATRNPVEFAVGFLIGIAVLLGMKLLLYHLWHLAGRSKARSEATGLPITLASVLSGVLVMAEVFLGATALVQFSHRVAFDASQEMQFAVAFFVALAISAPIVLISAVKGWKDGSQELTEDDSHELQRKYDEDHHRALIEHVESKYAIQLSDWEKDRLRHESEREKMLQAYDQQKSDLESYRKLPDYQALMKYIGRIDTINLLLEETESIKTRDSISRGHGKASVQ
ncbi:MAG: hypothetical protein KDC26_05800 [Armatimonadetes bacterium]|nr:hypothetical protein [Armatimonadota bacterium]